MSLTIRTQHTRACGSMIHNSRTVAVTQVSMTDEQTNKMWFIHAVEWYSVFKKEGNSDTCLVHMNSEVIMLNEVSQSQSTDDHMIQLT